MQLDPTKLAQIAMEWDPGPFNAALEQGIAQMSAQAQMEGPMGGGDWASIMGADVAPAPGDVLPLQGQGKPGAALDPRQMQALMSQMQPPPQQQARAPAVAPKQSPRPQYPGMPTIGQVPTLAQILQGKAA